MKHLVVGILGADGIELDQDPFPRRPMSRTASLIMDGVISSSISCLP